MPFIGTKLELNITVLLSFALFFYFGTSMFSGSYVIVIAVLYSLLFHISLLVHELSHAVMGRLRGYPVPRIIFYFIGAGTELDGKDPHPKTLKDEFLIGVVGPISNLLLAAMFFGISILFASVFDKGDTGYFFLILAVVNGLIGIYNLIPVYPMDGGRCITRSLVWKITGDHIVSMRYATRFGSFFGILLTGLGMGFLILPLFLGTSLSSSLLIVGIILLIYGLFACISCVAVYRSYLFTRQVRECMRSPSSLWAIGFNDSMIPAEYVISPAMHIKDTATMLRRLQVPTLYVEEENGALVGEVSMSNINEFFRRNGVNIKEA